VAAMPCGMESVISAANMTTIAFFIALPVVPAAVLSSLCERQVFGRAVHGSFRSFKVFAHGTRDHHRE
jgi:hypothetical protein